MPTIDAPITTCLKCQGEVWDNRGNKKNPNGPDLKHKDTGEGLWLGGRYPAPQWVLDRMPF